MSSSQGQGHGRKGVAKRSTSSASLLTIPVLSSFRNTMSKRNRTRNRRRRRERDVSDSTESSNSEMKETMEQSDDRSRGSSRVSNRIIRFIRPQGLDKRVSTRYRPSFIIPKESSNPRYRLQQVRVVEASNDVLGFELPSFTQGVPAVVNARDKGNVNNHYFSALKLDKKEQVEICVEMLMSTIKDDTLYVKRSVVKPAVQEFVLAVQESYTDTAFHNFRHAVDVAQLMYMIIHCYVTESPYSFSKLEPFFLIVSALCHDAKHFGANNRFLLESDKEGETEYVVYHGLESTLEHFHVSSAHKIINNCRLFSKEFMSDEQLKHLLELSEELILGTDMDKHDDFMNKYISVIQEETSFFKKLSHKVGLGGTKFPRAYLIAMLKVCDLANLTRVFEDHLEWTKLINVEYKAMGYKEDLKNLEVNDLIDLQQEIDKEEFQLVDIARHTLEFIHQIGVPLSTSFRAVSKKGSQTLVRLMEINSDDWVKRLEADGEDIESLKEIGVDIEEYRERNPRGILPYGFK